MMQGMADTVFGVYIGLMVGLFHGGVQWGVDLTGRTAEDLEEMYEWLIVVGCAQEARGQQEGA